MIECPLCAETFSTDDDFTSLSVNHHDDGDRDDFATSVHAACADELLSDLYEAGL